MPTYVNAREAYGLSTVSSFGGMPGDNAATKALLSDAYGAEIANLDAFVGAVAEESSDGQFFGDLLKVGQSDLRRSPIFLIFYCMLYFLSSKLICIPGSMS